MTYPSAPPPPVHACRRLFNLRGASHDDRSAISEQISASAQWGVGLYEAYQGPWSERTSNDRGRNELQPRSTVPGTRSRNRTRSDGGEASLAECSTRLDQSLVEQLLLLVWSHPTTQGPFGAQARGRPRSLEDLAGAPIWVDPGSALVVGQATRAAPLTGAAAFAWGRSLTGSSGPFHFASCQSGQRFVRTTSAFGQRRRQAKSVKSPPSRGFHGRPGLG
jgi:hypothetical protein